MESPQSEVDDVLEEEHVKTEELCQKRVTFSELPPGYTSSSRVFVIVSVVLALLILVSVGCVLFLGHTSNYRAEHIVMVMKNSMNLSADPCQDFYNYACGGWHDLDWVKNSEVVVSSLDSLTKSYQARILDLLAKPVDENEPIFKKQTKKFFSACKNQARRKIQGNAPFFVLLKSVGKFPFQLDIDPKWTEADFDFQGLVTNLTILGLHPFFSFKVDKEGNGRLASPSSDVREERLNCKGYADWLKTALRLLGNKSPGLELDREIDLVLRLDRRLLRIQKTTENQGMFLHIDELQHHLNWLDWYKFVDDISAVPKSYQQSHSIEAPRTFFVDDFLYFKYLYTDGLKRFSNRTIANFLMTLLLPFTQALNTSYPVAPYVADRLAQNPSLTDMLTDRCFFEASKIFEDQIDRMYLDEFYLEEYSFFLKDLLHDLKEAFYASALGKFRDTKILMSNLTVKTGYPSNLRKDEYLNRKLFSVSAEEYFEFYIQRSRLLYSFEIKPDAEEEINYSELTLRKYAFPSGVGGIAFSYPYLYYPAVAFQVPLFNPQWASSMNYGSIGTLSSLPLCHLILNGQWTGKYEDFRDCFVENFPDGEKFEGHKINQRPAELLHPIVDMYYTVQVSFKAYQNFLFFEGEGEPRIPGIQLNHPQLFFLSFAQMMCQKIPQHEIDSFISYSDGVPNYLRVTVALQNFKEFSQAYGCKQGDYMYHEETCWNL